MAPSIGGYGGGGSNTHDWYLYKPFKSSKQVTKVRKRTRVSRMAVKPIEHLVVQLGGDFQEIGGQNETVGGNDKKMG